jgi:uncharacterized membrane protein
MTPARRVLSAGCWVLSHARPALNALRRGVEAPLQSDLSAQETAGTKKLRAGVGGTQHSALSTQHLVSTQHSGLRTQDWVLGVITLVAVLVLAPEALACAVCYGAPGDPLVKGANNGIMFLLAVVGLVQIGFIAMFWSFWRRARAQRRFRESLRLIEGGPRS